MNIVTQLENVQSEIDYTYDENVRLKRAIVDLINSPDTGWIETLDLHDLNFGKIEIEVERAK